MRLNAASRRRGPCKRFHLQAGGAGERGVIGSPALSRGAGTAPERQLSRWERLFKAVSPLKKMGPPPPLSSSLSSARGPVKGGVFWQGTTARASRRRCQVGSLSLFSLPFHRRATKNYSKDSRGFFVSPTRLPW